MVRPAASRSTSKCNLNSLQPLLLTSKSVDSLLRYFTGKNLINHDRSEKNIRYHVFGCKVLDARALARTGPESQESRELTIVHEQKHIATIDCHKYCTVSITDSACIEDNTGTTGSRNRVAPIPVRFRVTHNWTTNANFTPA